MFIFSNLKRSSKDSKLHHSTSNQICNGEAKKLRNERKRAENALKSLESILEGIKANWSLLDTKWHTAVKAAVLIEKAKFTEAQYDKIQKMYLKAARDTECLVEESKSLASEFIIELASIRTDLRKSINLLKTVSCNYTVDDELGPYQFMCEAGRVLGSSNGHALAWNVVNIWTDACVERTKMLKSYEETRKKLEEKLAELVSSKEDSETLGNIQAVQSKIMKKIDKLEQKENEMEDRGMKSLEGLRRP